MQQSILFYNLKQIFFNFVGAFIGLSLFFYAGFLHAAEPSWEKSQWLKIMRYNKTFTGYESEVDNKEYFFSKDGKSNPKSEYNETLKAFNNLSQNQICKFPGRYLYLKRSGAVLRDFDLKNCSEFWSYKNKINLDSVSVIFSSFYIDKPASAFGHTLLKLNSKVKNGDVDLNSYGVDFSAQVTTKNPILYGIYGIIGGFFGRFSLLPYFLKLREYNDYESRDLWEFELNFTNEQKELFVAHLWDMNLALFDYYYFTENCSYHILRIIDAVMPEHDLIGQIGKVVIPIETVRPLLKAKNLLKSIHLRPSVHKRVKDNIKRLDKDALAYFSSAIAANKLTKNHNLNEQSYSSVLDALIDFIDYKYPAKIHLEKENEVQDFKQELLVARSMTEGKGLNTAKKIEKTEINIPHGTSYIGVGRVSGSANGQSLSFRSALHNILEPAGDVYANFTLEMNKLELFYDDTNQKLHLDDYMFARVFTLRPLSVIEKKISWDFSFGANENTFESSHITPYLHLGVGPSFSLFGVSFYTFIHTSFLNAFAATNERDNSIGSSVGFVYGFGSLRFNLNYKSLYEYSNLEFSHYQFSLNSLYTFTPSYALEIQSVDDEFDNRTRMSFQYKF